MLLRQPNAHCVRRDEPGEARGASYGRQHEGTSDRYRSCEHLEMDSQLLPSRRIAASASASTRRCLVAPLSTVWSHGTPC